MKAIGLRDVKRGMRLRVSVRYYNGVTGVFEGYADKDWEVIPADCHLRGSLDGPYTADRMWDADRMWIGGQEITAVELLDDEPYRIPAPTEPGWYAYSGGRHTMIFHLRESGQWSAHFDNGTAADCDWGYIEQALGVFQILPLDTTPLDKIT